MSSSFKSPVQLFGGASVGLMLAGAALLPLQAVAHEGHSEQTTPASAPSAVANQMVVRDAATGQLRPANAEEASALQAKGSAMSVVKQATPLKTMARSHASGAVGARLTDEFMSYSVLVRQPDGSMKAICVDSREEAEAAVKASPVAKPLTAPTE